MSGAAWALQKAIHQALATDAGVLAAIGGPRIYDDVPRGVTWPYVSFGAFSETDWSTGSDAASDRGSEHVVVINVWSEAAGRHEAAAVADAVVTALHDRPLTLTGCRLVSLRHEVTDLRRDAGADRFLGVVRLRAVTEPGD